MDTKEMNLQLRTHTALANDILIPSFHKKGLTAAHNSSPRGPITSLTCGNLHSHTYPQVDETRYIHTIEE